MDTLTQQATQLLSKLNNLASVADVLIVTLLVYGLLTLLQGTRASQVLRGGVILFMGLFLVSAVFRLPVLGWLVNNSLPALFLASAIIFAPELRRVLEQIGHTGDIFQRPLGGHSRDSLLLMIQEVCDSCIFLSRHRWGALIVIERNTGLQDLIVNGQIINGRVSSALLNTIFMVNSDLHDGAVIIRGDRVVAAHVTLPLSENFGSRQHLGHRHKAALGITEETDAVAIIVSEETGNITVGNNGELLQRLSKEKLREVLISLLQPSLLPAHQRQTQTKMGRMTQIIRNGWQRDTDWHNSVKNPTSTLTTIDDNLLIKDRKLQKANGNGHSSEDLTKTEEINASNQTETGKTNIKK